MADCKSSDDAFVLAAHTADPMNVVAVIQHTAGEYLGLMEDHLEGRRIRFQYFRPFAGGRKLPAKDLPADALVLLGGGPWGSAGGRDLPTLSEEIELTQAMLDRLREGGGRQGTGRIAGMHSGLLDMLHDAADQHILAVTDGVDIDLDGIIEGTEMAVPKEIDLQYAVAAALVGRAIKAKEGPDTNRVIGNILRYAQNFPQREMGVMLVSDMHRAIGEPLFQVPEFADWAKAIADVMLFE